MRTIRRDANQPAQRLRAWQDCRAPVPSIFPSAASPDGKAEVIFKPGSGESAQTGRLGTPAVPGQTRSARAQARSPRALETIGIHLNIALGLSNEVGPPHGEADLDAFLFERMYTMLELRGYSEGLTQLREKTMAELETGFSAAWTNWCRKGGKRVRWCSCADRSPGSSAMLRLGNCPSCSMT